MLLHEQHAGTQRVHGNVVNAVANLGGWVGNVFRVQSTVDRRPGFAAVIGAESARCRDGDKDSVRVARVKNDGVQTHPARAGLPHGAGAVSP